jgi:hypothetical protein
MSICPGIRQNRQILSISRNDPASRG